MVIAQVQDSRNQSSRRETPQSPAEEFLQSLFADAPTDQYLEIRAIPPQGKAQQHFLPLADLQNHRWRHIVPLHLIGGYNVHFGVCPRVRQRGGRADVSNVCCLWTDIDHGLPDPWPQSVPQPSIVVESSPGKHQTYWLLTRPSEDPDLVERIEDGLAAALGGDPASTDLARVLRLPGFPNLKYDSRPLSRLLELHPDRRYPLERFASLVTPRTPSHGPAKAHQHLKDEHDCAHNGNGASGAKSEAVKQEFQRLMAKLGVTPGVNPTWCFAHQDQHEEGRPSLSVDWEGCRFNCHSPRCGVHGRIGTLRKLAGATPPFVNRYSGWAQNGVSEKERLVAALREAGDNDSADAVQSCHRDYRVYRCQGCGKTPAYPISCGLPLCPACLSSRFYAFWQKHQKELDGSLALVRLTPGESFPLAQASMKRVRGRFTEWRERHAITCGLYALVPVVEHGRCRLSVLMVVPESEVSKVAGGRAFRVEVLSNHSAKQDACSWLIDSILEGATSWHSTEEMLALWSMLKGVPLVFGFGQWHKVRGGRSRGASSARPGCPFCGGDLTPLGVVPGDSVTIEDGHTVWRPPRPPTEGVGS